LSQLPVTLESICLFVNMTSKVILITGISSGFGLEMARSLSACGHIVYGTVRSDVDHLPDVHYLLADVRSDEQVSAAVNTVVAEQGRIDVLINNAGMGIGGPSEFLPMEDIERQMDTNFMGLVRTTKAVLPHMRGASRGTIVAFSSIGGLLGLPFQGFYSASKFAVEGYCEALRMEVRRFGIKVVVIEPGDFHTGFTGKRSKVCCEDALAAYPSYQRSISSAEHDENTGLSPEFLAAKIVRIIGKKNPRCRYMIATVVQKSSVLLKKIMPDMAFSKMIAWFYKL